LAINAALLAKDDDGFDTIDSFWASASGEAPIALEQSKFAF